MATATGHTSAHSSETSGTLIRVLLAVVAIGLFGGLTYAGFSYFRGDEDAGPVLSTHRVVKDKLVLTVTEDGNVESANNVDVVCQVEGGSSILWIIPDGSDVKKGDKIVELDSATLSEQTNTQKITTSKAESAVISAQKNVDVAKIGVQEYLEVFQRDLQDQDSKITIAEENARNAKSQLDHAEKMYQRGYISELDLESQKFAVKRAQLDLASAQTTKEVLEKYTKVKTLTDLESKVDTAVAALKAEEAAFNLEKSKLDRLEGQLKHCTIVAPQDGMVVYANEQGRFGQQGATIEEGAAVRQRQKMIKLPDLSKMQVKVTVHETKVTSLRKGMRARINIQGRELQGTVQFISNQPEASNWMTPNVKEFATIVKVDGTPENLKPGMTAEVEILVAHVVDALTIPISSIVEQSGKYFCWVRKPDGQVEKRPLLLGVSNEQFVAINDGVAEGDDVIRNPRAVIQEAREGSEGAEITNEVDVNKRFGDTAGSPDLQKEKKAAPAGGDSAGATDRASGGGGSFDLTSYDKNKDGKVAKDEAPEQIQSFFDRFDTNKDGALDKAEMDAISGPKKTADGEATAGAGGDGAGGPGGGGPGGGGAGGGGRGNFDLMSNDKNGDGKVAKDELPEQMQGFFDRMDSNKDGFVDKAESDAARARRGGGGGAFPTTGAAYMKQNDKNADGKVTEDELPEMARQFFGAMDTNGDGGVDKDEADALIKRMQEMRRNGGFGGGGGGGGQGGGGGF